MRPTLGPGGSRVAQCGNLSLSPAEVLKAPRVLGEPEMGSRPQARPSRAWMVGTPAHGPDKPTSCVSHGPASLRLMRWPIDSRQQ